MLRIGEFSKLSRISIRMLRYYDEISFLKQALIDVSTGYRYYNENQLFTCGKISALKEMGFSLAEITDIINNHNNLGLYESYLEKKLSQTIDDISNYKHHLSFIELSLERKKASTIVLMSAVKLFPHVIVLLSK